MKKYIVIVSDCSDVAYNEMRAQLIHHINKAKGNDYDVEIESLVQAKEFSIINGAFLVRLMAELYPPKNTIFLVIINPFKIRPARIIGETNNGFKFVGNNSGVFNWLIDDFGLKELYEVNDTRHLPFGGKYVHAPIAAKLSMGKNFKKLGKKKNKSFLSNFHIQNGTVIHIDNFGSIKIKGMCPKYKAGDILEVYINGKKKLDAIFTHNMRNLEDGTWALYSGSSFNMPELGRVRSLDGPNKIGVKIGDIIKWRKKI